MSGHLSSHQMQNRNATVLVRRSQIRTGLTQKHIESHAANGWNHGHLCADFVPF